MARKRLVFSINFILPHFACEYSMMTSSNGTNQCPVHVETRLIVFWDMELKRQQLITAFSDCLSLIYTKRWLTSPRNWGYIYCFVTMKATLITTDQNMVLVLTHCGRDKMSAILQRTFSNVCSWMKMFGFRFKFHWILFLRVQLTIFNHWFR